MTAAERDPARHDAIGEALASPMRLREEIRHAPPLQWHRIEAGWYEAQPEQDARVRVVQSVHGEIYWSLQSWACRAGGSAPSGRAAIATAEAAYYLTVPAR
jgi:hypothetical protein